ncbi:MULTISPECIES: hypothetical protein [unclassified Haladaptatus]|uniref:hypothetical protein n=1 Tax=unclassified Haladaptatus TaxID=2622732 RepID=UPI0023E7BE1D|nr:MULTISPECIES: hypothetical protein [unclassified Haladaptatus]
MTTHRPALTCYRCGHQYDYLGTTPHPGRCPACDSRAVTPAGNLVVVGTETDTDGDPPVVRLQATDGSDRTFRFTFEITGEGKVALRRLLVDNTLIRSPDGTWPEAVVAEPIRETLADAGYSLAPTQ